MIYDVKDDPNPLSLQSGTINILQVPPSAFSAKSCQISPNFQDIPKIIINMINDVKGDPILLVSNQELSMSSKAPPL